MSANAEPAIPTDTRATVRALHAALRDMNIPLARRPLSPDNVCWLLRHLYGRNPAHPEIGRALALLRELNRLAPPAGEAAPALLHVYAQIACGEPATLVGTRQALEALRQALDTALAQGWGEAQASVNDGMAYRTVVIRDDSPCLPGARWWSRPVPYVED